MLANSPQNPDLDPSVYGGIFSERIPGGRAGARIDVRHQGLHVVTYGGEVFELPYSDVVLGLGGAHGSMIFCRPRDQSFTVFCDDKHLIEQMERRGGVGLQPQLEQLRQSLKKEQRRRMLGYAALLLCVVGLISLGVWGFKRGVSHLTSVIPFSVDGQIGNAAFSMMDLGGTKTTHDEADAMIASIVKRLSPQFATAAGKPVNYRVQLVKSDVVNAFALPGGQLIVYTGLLSHAESAEQVASVLAHEMAHVTNRHGTQRVLQSLGVFAVFQLLVGDVAGVVAAAGDLLSRGVVNAYSRDQELEADRDGVRALAKSHIDPNALVQFFEILKKESGDTPAALAWLSTHPDHAKRVATLQAEIKTLAPTSPVPIEGDWSLVHNAFKGD